jgi:hypothetical protein
MSISGRFPRGSLGLRFKVLLALYMFAAALMPFGHHDLACHLKSTTHCTTCTVGSSAEAGGDAAVLARFWLLDAGAILSAPVETARLSIRRPPSGRAPPSFV